MIDENATRDIPIAYITRNKTALPSNCAVKKLSRSREFLFKHPILSATEPLPFPKTLSSPLVYYETYYFSGRHNSFPPYKILSVLQ